MVDTQHLKCCGLNSRVGSSPTSGTRIELSGFFETKEWACRRHAHSVCPDFAGEERIAGAQARRILWIP